MLLAPHKPAPRITPQRLSIRGYVRQSRAPFLAAQMALATGTCYDTARRLLHEYEKRGLVRRCRRLSPVYFEATWLGRQRGNV